MTTLAWPAESDLSSSNYNSRAAGALSDSTQDYFPEPLRQEFAGIVGVERTDDTNGLSLAYAKISIERGDERLYLLRRFGFLSEKVNRLETTVVIDVS